MRQPGQWAYDHHLRSREDLHYAQSDPVERGRWAAAEFYKSLGFAETFRVPKEGPPVQADLRLDGYKIGFAPIDSAREDHGLDPVASG
ncbi:MAG: hypothetical protein ACLP8X_18725 [Streptosporangiaceae bacterium]|jgi:hypothetical protein